MRHGQLLIHGRILIKIKRAEILLKIADVIDANKEDLAYIESLDNGKPLRETLNVDIPFAADHFRYFASAIRTEEDTFKTSFDSKTPLSCIQRAYRCSGTDSSMELPVPYGGMEACTCTCIRMLYST